MSAGRARWRSRRRCKCTPSLGLLTCYQGHKQLLSVASSTNPFVGLMTLQALPAANIPHVKGARSRQRLSPCLACVLCSEYSKTLNDARLKVLAARETAIQAVVKEARARVRDLARNPTAYKKLLQDLLVQVRA